MQIEIRNFSTKTMSVKLFLRSINMLKPQTAQCKKKKKKKPVTIIRPNLVELFYSLSLI